MSQDDDFEQALAAERARAEADAARQREGEEAERAVVQARQKTLDFAQRAAMLLQSGNVRTDATVIDEQRGFEDITVRSERGRFRRRTLTTVERREVALGSTTEAAWKLDTSRYKVSHGAEAEHDAIYHVSVLLRQDGSVARAWGAGPSFDRRRVNILTPILTDDWKFQADVGMKTTFASSLGRIESYERTELIRASVMRQEDGLQQLIAAFLVASGVG